MAGGKVVVNLATGLEDAERVTIAFLVAGPGGRAREAGHDVPHEGRGAARAARRGARASRARAARRSSGCSSSTRRRAASCSCARSASTRAGSTRRELVANARIGGATPLWDWIGDEPATVFSY